MGDGVSECPNCGYKPVGPDDQFYTAHGGKGECPRCGIVISKSFSRPRITILDAEIDMEKCLADSLRGHVFKEFMAIVKRPLVLVPASALLFAVLAVVYIDDRDDLFTDKKVGNVIASLNKKELQKKECFEGAAKEARSDQGFRILAAKCQNVFEEDTAVLNQRYLRLTAQPTSSVYKEKLHSAQVFCSQYVIGNNKLLDFYKSTNGGNHSPGIFLQVNCRSALEKTGEDVAFIDDILREAQRLQQIGAVAR